MKKTLILFAVILLASCRFGSNSLYTQGEKAFLQGDNTKAIELFGKAIRLNPENTLAYTARSFTYYKLHDLKNAIADAEQVIAINPKMVSIYLNLARYKVENLDTSGAIRCLNKAITEYPNYCNAYMIRGSIKYALKNYQGAVNDATNAIRVEPDDTMKLDSVFYAYAFRAMAVHKLDDNERAFKDMDTAMKLAPTHPRVLYTMGRLYFDIGKYDEATFYLEKANKRNKDDGYCWLLLGVTDIKNGHHDIGCSEMMRAKNKGIKEAVDSLAKYCK